MIIDMSIYLALEKKNHEWFEVNKEELAELSITLA